MTILFRGGVECATCTPLSLFKRHADVVVVVAYFRLKMWWCADAVTGSGILRALISMVNIDIVVISRIWQTTGGCTCRYKPCWYVDGSEFIRQMMFWRDGRWIALWRRWNSHCAVRACVFFCRHHRTLPHCSSQICLYIYLSVSLLPEWRGKYNRKSISKENKWGRKTSIIYMSMTSQRKEK